MGLLRAVSGRIRSYRLIFSAVTHHGPRIVEILDRRVNAFLPDHLKIDFWRYMQAILDVLKRRCDTLTGAESELAVERGNDPRKRRWRDRHSTDLRRLMMRFRDAFESNYMPDNLEEYGFPTELSTVPLDTLRQADHLVAIFRRPETEIPDPDIGDGLPIDVLVGEIATAADLLRAQLDEVDRENRLAQAAQVDKDRAVDGWDDVVSWAVRALADLFRQAGEHELAAQILPVASRQGRIVQVVDGDDGTGDGGSGDGGSGDGGSGDGGSGDGGPGDDPAGDEGPADPDAPAEDPPGEDPPSPDSGA